MSKYSDPITATGSLITFDAPTGGVFDSLSVPITPTQDLHGYSQPWPAGGGKNLANLIEDGYVPSVSNGQLVPASGCRTDYIKVSPNGAYTLSYIGTGIATIYYMVYASDKSYIRYDYITNNPQTITLNSTDEYVMLRTTNSLSAFDWFQFEAGSSATSYAPYSNICPISGRTGLSVYVSPTQDQQDATTYAVDWSTQAGTVYGGTVDVVTGVLTVTHKGHTFNGSETWDYWNGVFVNYDLTDIARSDSTSSSNVLVIADRFKPNGVQYRAGCGDGNIIKVVGANNQIACYSSTFADENAFKTYLAIAPMTVVYKLATPLTYQLTGQEIAALVGSNNVWVDTSAVITLIYRLLQVDRQTDRTSIGKRAESLDVLGKFSSISKVEVNVTENLFYEAGDSSGRTLTVDCPFGTQAMANNLLAMLQGYVYQPFEARRSIANPATELGDGVTVGDVYGGIYAIYHKCGPLHLADLSAPADEEIDHEYKFTPAAERKIERRLNNMESELSVQAGEISAKVDRQGGDPSSVSWLMDSDVFKVAVDGSDVLTVDENGLTVNGDGTFTGSVQAKNIQYGGDAGTMSGNGITSRSIGTGRLTSGINVSLGNADFSADVFSGAATASYTKAKNLYCVGRFLYNGTEFSPAVYYLLDQNNNVVRLRVLQS